MHGIILVPLGAVDPNVPDFLTFALHDTFNVPCRIQRTNIPLDVHYSIERQQYHSTRILAELLPLAKGRRDHILGIADVDLYIPILTFVFGEAQLGKQCALVSVFRLHQRFYGLPDDESNFFLRCEKEAVHELGHTLGLTHCRNFECVMHYGNIVEDIDLKRNVFCPVCARQAGLRTLWR